MESCVWKSYSGSMPLTLRLVLAVVGALSYAAAGALMGAQNAGWFGLEANANPLLPALGVGAALVVVAFMGSSFSLGVRRAGGFGRASQILLVVGCLLFILGPLIDFAILGTLSLAAGLFFLTITVIRNKLGSVVDRALISVSAIGSITWNTETVSAFFLVGVGLIWLVLAVRLLPAGETSDL